MKRILAFALAGAMLFGGGAALADDEKKADNCDDCCCCCVHHWHHFHLKGTVDHWTSGQLFIKTPENQIVQVPHMAMQYNMDPKVTFATVVSGTAVNLRVPWRGFHPIVARNGYHEIMNYDGTWILPDAVFDAIHKHQHDADCGYDDCCDDDHHKN